MQSGRRSLAPLSAASVPTALLIIMSLLRAENGKGTELALF